MSRKRPPEPDDKPLPDRPTKHVPGSDEKIRVMRRRMLAGRSLWRPDDKTLEGVNGDDKGAPKGRMVLPAR